MLLRSWCYVHCIANTLACDGHRMSQYMIHIGRFHTCRFIVLEVTNGILFLCTRTFIRCACTKGINFVFMWAQHGCQEAARCCGPAVGQTSCRAHQPAKLCSWRHTTCEHHRAVGSAACKQVREKGGGGGHACWGIVEHANSTAAVAAADLAMGMALA
jgi:hypothetical protein